MACTTREQLGAALKEALSTAALDKVTVSKLSTAVGINRQSFYYHFADVYDLAVWVFEVEVANHIMAHANYDQWADGYRTLLNYMRENFDQTLAVLNSLGHKQRDAFFLEQFRAMMRAIVAELEGDLILEEEDRQFIIDHFAGIVLGHFLRWLTLNGQEDPDILVPRIEKIMRGNVRTSLERFAKGQR